MKYALPLFSCILVFLTSLNSFGQDKAPVSNEHFLQQAEIDAVNVVSLGIFAQKKVVDKQLKKYSLMAHNESIKANKKLLALAIKKNVSLPNLLADSSNLEELPLPDNMLFSSEETPDLVKNIFDVSYVKMMIEDHNNIIRFYERSSNTADADIKSYIDEYLPVLKRNLQHVIKFTSQRMLARE